MRTSFFFVALSLVVACASSEPSPADASKETSPNDNAGDGEVAGGSTSNQPATLAAYDLVVRATDLSTHWTTLGETEVEMIVAVRDEWAGERVAWIAKTTKPPAKTAELRFPGLLKTGGNYRVAVSGVGMRPLFAVGPVTEEVVLEVDKAPPDESSTDDAVAYDILDTPVTLSPGTYTASLGPASTSIKVIVDTKGKLSLRRADYGCGAGACGIIQVLSDPLCEPEFVRADTMSAKITDADGKQSLVLALKQEGAGIRVQGKIASGSCCSETVDVLAKKTSADLGACK